MVQLVEMSEIKRAVVRPSTRPEESRLPLYHFGVVVKRIKNLPQKNDWTEHKIRNTFGWRGEMQMSIVIH